MGLLLRGWWHPVVSIRPLLIYGMRIRAFLVFIRGSAAVISVSAPCDIQPSIPIRWGDDRYLFDFGACFYREF